MSEETIYRIRYTQEQVLLIKAKSSEEAREKLWENMPTRFISNKADVKCVEFQEGSKFL